MNAHTREVSGEKGDNQVPLVTHVLLERHGNSGNSKSAKLWKKEPHETIHVYIAVLAKGIVGDSFYLDFIDSFEICH